MVITAYHKLARGFEFIAHDRSLPINLTIQPIARMATPLHWHDDLEFLFVVRGHLQVFVESRKYNLHDGDFILVNRGQIHRTIGLDGSNLIFVFQLDPEYLEKFGPRLQGYRFACISTSLKLHADNLVGRFRRLLSMILMEESMQKTGYQFAVESCIDRLMIIMLREIRRVPDRTPILDENLTHQRRLRKMVDFVGSNYREKILLRDLAKDQGVNESYLSRYFKKHMGQNFRDYLNMFRLYKGINLLADPGATITEVVYESGFSDPRMFNRLFRRVYGTTPTHWRRLHSEGRQKGGTGPGEERDRQRILSETLEAIRPYLTQGSGL